MKNEKNNQKESCLCPNEKYARKQREIWCGTKGSLGLCASIRMPQGSHSLIEEGEGGWRTYILSLSPPAQRMNEWFC